MTGRRQALGRAGEELAARWYADRGYRIVARNWRAGREGELDLVVRKGRSLLVFCEVKARGSQAYGHPAEAVGPRKQAQVRRLARRFLTEHRAGAREIRFDVVCVLDGRVTVLTDAF